MNNNKIQNPMVETMAGIKKNDKDHIRNLLSELKAMVKNYAVALTEASNEVLYDMYFQTFTNISGLQRETYELMFRFGWYQLEKAECQKITEQYHQQTKEYQDLKNKSKINFVHLTSR